MNAINTIKLYLIRERVPIKLFFVIFTAMYLNSIETKIINLLKKRSPLTASEIANEISIHPKLLQIILNDLLMDSVIAVEDTDFGKRYSKQ